ncbi:MAG: hypothetical protein R3B45_02115 [Bdellovibrionota bacterium]
MLILSCKGISDFPVFPGVLIVEGVAQTAGVLGYVSLPDGFDKCLLTEITKTRFRKQVIPGDVLTYEIKVKRARAPFFGLALKRPSMAR